MRVAIILGLVFRFCAAAQSPEPQPARPANVVALTHVGVIDVQRGQLLADQTVIIRGNRIVSVAESRSSRTPAGARTIACNHKYLIPGLWDMHAHGSYVSWTLTMSAVNGVLGLRDMGMPLAQTKAFRRTADGYRFIGDLPIPVRVGAMAGPLMDSYNQWPGMTMVVRNPEEGRPAVDLVKAAGVDFVKIHTQMSSETWWSIVARAREVKLPFAGHIPYAISAAAASNAGQRSIEHLEGLPMACSSEEEDLRRDAAEHTPTAEGTGPQTAYRLARRFVQTFDRNKCEALAATLARNQTWNVPTLVTLEPDTTFHRESDPRFKYIPDILLELWKTPPDEISPDYRRLFEEYTEIVRILNKSGVPLMTGTDCPIPGVYPGFAVHEDLALLVRAALTPAEALRAATLNPALFLHMGDRLGSVTSGKFADLVLLDENPLADIHNTTKIQAVIADGQVFDRAALDKMLEDLVQNRGTGMSGPKGSTGKTEIH
jgi:imidazolonepropionase-like amidohydrolase